jgi:hypothetical protein
MNSRLSELDDHTPEELLVTDPAAVEAVLDRIEYGVFWRYARWQTASLCVWAYRVCSRYLDPRDPAGAARHGGRWNPPGVPALYAASSLVSFFCAHPDIAASSRYRLSSCRRQSRTTF